MIKKILSVLILLASSASTFSATQQNVSVRTIGIGLNTNPNMTGNFRIIEELTAACPYGLIHFNATNNIGKAMYSTILMAQAANKKLSRIDYFLNENKNFCSLSYIEVTK